MSKGSNPRPYSVSQAEFGHNFDRIFGKTKHDTNCKKCYNCLSKVKDEHGLPVTSYTFIVCEHCGNKRCPHATNHNLACTDNNDVGQQGSRYQ
jgi:hypothetical protein